MMILMFEIIFFFRETKSLPYVSIEQCVWFFLFLSKSMDVIRFLFDLINSKQKNIVNFL
jgi:hypothetical protein